MRVLIDASVLIRALLLSPNPARAVDVIIGAALDGTFGLLLPPDLLTEVADKIIHDPYLATRIDSTTAAAFEATLRGAGLLVPPLHAPPPRVVRDPKDDYLIAYALRDRAEFLVTGDRDLLDLAPGIAAPRIVDPGAFVRHPRERGLL